MRRVLQAIALFQAVAMCLLPSMASAAYGTHQAPKLLNVYLDWKIPDADMAMLSRWDVVVLDMDLQWSAPEKIRALRRLNPNIKILAYVSASEIADARGKGDHASPGYHLFSRVTESMYVHRSDGSRASWWPGAALLNVSASVDDLHAWPHVLMAFVQDELMATKLWDGVFLDGAYADPVAFFGSNIDLDGDGQVDDAAVFTSHWQSAMHALVQGVRTVVGPRGLVLVNTGDVYASDANGNLFENFSQYGWSVPFRLLRQAMQKNIAPGISAINVNTKNQETPDAYQTMRYGLGSALLAGAYFSFDAGDQGHARTWWYDEYDAPLGRPIGEPQSLAGDGDGLWQRTYERGVVFVNSGDATSSVALPGPYERLHGVQDPTVNTGAVGYYATLPPHDGLIVLRPIEADLFARGDFEDGAEYAVYDAEGRVHRQNFVATQTNAKAGSAVHVRTYDGWKEVVSYDGAQVSVTSVRDGVSEERRFLALGSSLAVVHAATGTHDLYVVAPRAGESTMITIVEDMNGKKVSWRAFPTDWKGETRIATGDVNGDGSDEVVVTSGAGRATRIAIYTASGKKVVSFAPFGITYRDGAFISVGDVDGDGKNEIVVGSGSSRAPRVRLFDGAGHLKKDWGVPARLAVDGVRVTAVDVDGDYRADVLIRAK